MFTENIYGRIGEGFGVQTASSNNSRGQLRDKGMVSRR